jgi:pyruvate/2-oxoglutarate dehydrogenase complex dihydrolipoamide dehydrogenase (E3) component
MASGGPLADDAPEDGYDYDLIVLGGGSGGLAISKEAAALGKKVAVFDFVKPSPQGTTWGLGGTCVNVGCIPKKLMHQAGIVGASLKDAKAFGWEFGGDEATHNWQTMVTAVQDHISSLNWGYKVQLRDKKVTYKNEFAAFIDPHTIETEDKRGRKKTYTARRFVIACGGRPTYDEHIDPSLYLTSDDLFSMEKPPGKTLVVGASYVALECAGFISHLGMDATVMMRSIPLRGFDQQMSNMIVDYMEGKTKDQDGNMVSVNEGEGEHRHTTNFLKGYVVDTVELQPDGKKKVTWKSTKGDQPPGSDTFDTMFYAIGREACTKGLNPDSAGLVTERNGKLVTTCEQTNVPNIYAIGDVRRSPIPTATAGHGKPRAPQRTLLLCWLHLSLVDVYVSMVGCAVWPVVNGVYVYAGGLRPAGAHARRDSGWAAAGPSVVRWLDHADGLRSDSHHRVHADRVWLLRPRGGGRD